MCRSKSCGGRRCGTFRIQSRIAQDNGMPANTPLSEFTPQMLSRFDAECAEREDRQRALASRNRLLSRRQLKHFTSSVYETLGEEAGASVGELRPSDIPAALLAIESYDPETAEYLREATTQIPRDTETDDKRVRLTGGGSRHLPGVHNMVVQQTRFGEDASDFDESGRLRRAPNRVSANLVTLAKLEESTLRNQDWRDSGRFASEEDYEAELSRIQTRHRMAQLGLLGDQTLLSESSSDQRKAMYAERRAALMTMDAETLDSLGDSERNIADRVIEAAARDVTLTPRVRGRVPEVADWHTADEIMNSEHGQAMMQKYGGVPIRAGVVLVRNPEWDDKAPANPWDEPEYLFSVDGGEITLPVNNMDSVSDQALRIPALDLLDDIQYRRGDAPDSQTSIYAGLLGGTVDENGNMSEQAENTRREIRRAAISAVYGSGVQPGEDGVFKLNSDQCAAIFSQKDHVDAKTVSALTTTKGRPGHSSAKTLAAIARTMQSKNGLGLKSGTAVDSEITRTAAGATIKTTATVLREQRRKAGDTDRIPGTTSVLPQVDTTKRRVLGGGQFVTHPNLTNADYATVRQGVQAMSEVVLGDNSFTAGTSIDGSKAGWTANANVTAPGRPLSRERVASLVDTLNDTQAGMPDDARGYKAWMEERGLRPVRGHARGVNHSGQEMAAAAVFARELKTRTWRAERDVRDRIARGEQPELVAVESYMPIDKGDNTHHLFRPGRQFKMRTNTVVGNSGAGESPAEGRAVRMVYHTSMAVPVADGQAVLASGNNFRVLRREVDDEGNVTVHLADDITVAAVGAPA